MRLYISLIFTLIVMAFSTGYFALYLYRPSSASPENILEINRIKLEFQKRVRPLRVINFRSIYYSGEHLNLLNPTSAMRHIESSESVEYSGEKDCFDEVLKLMSPNNVNKVLFWEKFRCKDIRRLPYSFFINPPFIHPSGFSYVYLAVKSGKGGYANKEWIKDHLPYFHVHELPEINEKYGPLKGAFFLLANMKPEEVDAINDGVGTILTKDFLLARIVYAKNKNILEYRIYDREELNNFLDATNYRLSKYRERKSCFYREEDLCWNYNTKHVFQLMSTSSFIFFVGLISIICIVSIFLFKKIKMDRREDERRRLALKVLTHEFRTPIASMLLSLENLSKNLASLDETTQEDVLRISSEAYRMKRLTEMSRQYLSLKQTDKLLQLNFEEIPSVNMLIEEILDPFFHQHGDQLIFVALKEDKSLKLDAYWFSIMVKNIVSNAFQHGQAPVTVKLVSENGNFELIVSDNGQVEDRLEDLKVEFAKGNKSEGSGLGLNIVSKIVEQFEGELKLEKNPTRFKVCLNYKKLENLAREREGEKYE